MKINYFIKNYLEKLSKCDLCLRITKNDKIISGVLSKLIRGVSYWSLSLKERQIADILKDEGIINNFTFSVNTEIFNSIKPKTGHYLILIDAFKAGLYRDIKAKLIDKKHILTSYRAIGEKDFVCFFTGPENQLKDFLSEISLLFKNVKPKNIIQCLSLKSYFSRGKFIEHKINQKFLSDQAKFAEIESCLDDYRQFPPAFLSQLEGSNILSGYKIIYDFLKLRKLRIVIIVWSSINIKDFLISDGAKINVIEAFAFISLVDGYGDTGDPETTYTDTANVIVCEFDNINQYKTWMDDFYSFTTEINCLSIVIEDNISERTMSISNYYEFSKLCNKYKFIEGNAVKIGKPVMSGDEPDLSSDVCIDIAIINRHGLICGNPRSGKTNTAVLIAESAASKGINVHILDVKGDEEKFQKYEEFKTDEFVKNGIPIAKSSGGIRRYEIPLAKDDSDKVKKWEFFIIPFLEEFKKLGESGGKITHLVLIDEFVQIASPQILDKLDTTLDFIPSKGVGIWCISQEIKHFSQTKISEKLKNKIIHQLFTDDIPLLNNIPIFKKPGIYSYGFEESVLKLRTGQAYVTFVDNEDNLLKPPIKVQMNEIGK